MRQTIQAFYQPQYMDGTVFMSTTEPMGNITIPERPGTIMAFFQSKEWQEFRESHGKKAKEQAKIAVFIVSFS